MDFSGKMSKDREENMHIPSSAMGAAQCGSSCSQLLGCPGSAQLSSARLSSAAPGPCLELSVEGFSKEIRRFLHLWLSPIEASEYENTVQGQKECISEVRKRQKLCFLYRPRGIKYVKRELAFQTQSTSWVLRAGQPMAIPSHPTGQSLALQGQPDLHPQLMDAPASPLTGANGQEELENSILGTCGVPPSNPRIWRRCLECRKSLGEGRSREAATSLG